MFRKTKHETPVKPMKTDVKVALIVAAVLFVGFNWFLWRQAHPAYGHDLPRAVEATSSAPRASALGGRIRFVDAQSQAREFIGYSRSIRLSPEQQRVKEAALGSRPAACCRGSNALTCCCPCNLSKTVWGLTNFAIARHGATAEQVHEVVDTWLTFVNPSGYRGDTCQRGECDLPAAQKGCGGMTEQHLSL